MRARFFSRNNYGCFKSLTGNLHKIYCNWVLLIIGTNNFISTLLFIRIMSVFCCFFNIPLLQRLWKLQENAFICSYLLLFRVYLLLYQIIWNHDRVLDEIILPERHVCKRSILRCHSPDRCHCWICSKENTYIYRVTRQVEAYISLTSIWGVPLACFGSS